MTLGHQGMNVCMPYAVFHFTQNRSRFVYHHSVNDDCKKKLAAKKCKLCKLTFSLNTHTRLVFQKKSVVAFAFGAFRDEKYERVAKKCFNFETKAEIIHSNVT